MKRQMRYGVFETNSSSVHSLTICSKNDYDRWVGGELVFSRWGEELCEVTPEIVAEMEKGKGGYLTYDQFNDYEYLDFETFEREYTSESGDELVAFGYHGYDG